MKCNKCGSEVKETNLFCTNCGEKLKENINEKVNKERKKFNIKVWHIIVVVLLVIFIVIFCLFASKINNKNDSISNVNTVFNDDVNNTALEIDTVLEERNIIAKKYMCTNAGSGGYLIFNDDNTFEMKLGDIGTEYYILKGSYKINNNMINVHVNYDSGYLIISVEDEEKEELDPSFKEYDTTINILSYDKLEFTDELVQTYIFKIDTTAENESNNTETELLEKIYGKYPELENKEGYICTDGEQYWVLDKSGKKIYFYDLNSFESAMVKSYTSEESKEKYEQSDEETIIQNDNSKKSKSKNETTANEKDYIDIPNLSGMTEQQAISKTKELGVKYQITYQEDLDKKEGIVLDQTYHNELITDNKGKVIGAHSRRILYPGETLDIYVNRYNERTVVFNLHRTCLIKKYILKKQNKYEGVVNEIDSPLDLVVKINGEAYLNDKLTNKDLEVKLYNCTTSKITYTGKYAPEIEIFVNNELFEKYDAEDMRYDFFYRDTNNEWNLTFAEHGAG